MNSRATRAIVRKDLMVVLRTKPVALPMLIVPLMVLLALPVLLAILAQYASDPSLQTDLDLSLLLNNLPEPAREGLSKMTVEQQFAYLALVYVMAPLFLLIPCVVAVVVAADSFAGEKERRTLEALLYTPLSDLHLFVSKVLSACVPAMAVAVGSFAIYCIVANAAAWPVMQRIFFPTPMWLVLVFWLTPAVAVMSLGTTVLVSSITGTFQAAYQLGSLVVLPIVFLIVMQARGLLFFQVWVVFVLGLAFWLLGGTLVLIGARSFRRTRVATRI
jgi:ABC-type Na+ efflux pump permease subunit